MIEEPTQIDPQTQRLGRDEWVAEHARRTARLGGVAGWLVRLGLRIPLWGRLALVAGVGLAIPLLTSSSYMLRIAGTVALLAILALGLNMVAGYAGLLDLGFVAFYGLGAYTYAYLSSPFTGVHLPSWASLLIVTGLGALFGLLLGSPSIRLVGDYLAIATLAFGLIFVQLTTTLTRVQPPWADRPINLTGGPNGIVNLDPISMFGITLRGNRDYYLFLLVILLGVITFVHHVNQSRMGRGWRALREDELATEVMGMPTRRLKLAAFMMGSATAGLTGAVFAAWQGAVFPANFDVTLLITLYAAVVLGGLGSIPGVIFGAMVLVVVPEFLRGVDRASLLFYGGVLITLFAVLRPRWKPLLILAGAVGLTGIIRLLSGVLPADALVELPQRRGITGVFRAWLVVPAEAGLAGSLALLLLLILMLVAAYLPYRNVRLALLVPGLYLMAVVWETRMVDQPSVTRLMLVGAVLVVLMNFRPNGLFGRRRVEIV